MVCVVWRKRREKAVVKHVYDTPYGPNLGNREFVPQYSVYAGQSGFAQKNENNGTQELAGSNTEKERRPQHGLQEMENNYGHNNLPAGHRPQEMPS